MSDAFPRHPMARFAPAPIAIAVLAFLSGTVGVPVTRAEGTAAIAAGQALPSVPPPVRTLTMEERIEAQRAIEEVYWRHRIWPKENRTPKPPLSAVVSDEAIRAKVEDYLKKSNALETWWQKPVTAAQLQAELNRMSKGTRDPGILRELYAALGNDAGLIAETLARPTLVDRLIHNWYANDERFHGAVRRQAEQALGAAPSVAELRTLGGEYSERTVVRQDGTKRLSVETRRAGVVELDAEEWTKWHEDMARRLGSPQDAIPTGQLSALQEEADGFLVTAVLSLEADEAVVASVVWPKRSFDSWWSEARRETGSQVEGEAVSYSIRTPADGGCVDDTWQRGDGMFPAASSRGRHTAVWTGSEMIVWGGGGWETWSGFNTGLRYNPSTDTWTPTSTGANVPQGRRNHTAVWTGTEMIVWGGDYYGGTLWQALETGGRYNPSTDTWIPTSLRGVPRASTNHTAVWTGTTMIVWGGEEFLDDYGQRDLNTGGVYNPSTNEWTPTSTGANVPSARRSHTAVWTGTEMIVWGGFGGGSTGGRYNPATGTWAPTSTGANVPSARGDHTAVWTGTEMIVWGGWYAIPVDTGGRYNPTTDTWTPTPMGANVPEARWRHTAVWTGSEMIVWGGFGDYDPLYPRLGYLNTGGRYNPTTDAWTPTSMGANVPSARDYHTAVWTGTEMIVWGGLADDHYVNPGGRYDPTTDTWAPGWMIAPTPRGSHTAVWTGTEMIVWGGITDASYAVNTGGRYNPTTDTWTPTPMGANVPEARSRHTVVWTGTEMIVWGGFDRYGDPTDTGGRYDPSTESWLPTSRGANVPEARAVHGAVWTGTEMIVWGGAVCFNCMDSLNTGGRYDPAMGTWAPTSTGANVPSARGYHTAVWTGTEMIVWGGGVCDAGCGDCVNTGGRYDPTTDTWTPTPMGANVPEYRLRHTAVWTGSEMIVWGGYNDAAPVDTGGRYDPASDSWTATSTEAGVLPGVRLGHTAVWTGTEMIVWGGFGDYAPYYHWLGYLNTGGRYCACGVGAVSTWYPDADGDGYGVASTGVPSCSQPPGYVAYGGDCNDSVPGINPGETETCNAIDDNCDGLTDNGMGPGTVQVMTDPATLWPPNHRMVDVHATVSLSGGCPSACPAPPTVVLASLDSSEPDDAAGSGDGHTTGDIQGATIGSADFDFQLRAERDGHGDGRLYRIGYEASDCFGDTSVGYGAAVVPHDQGGQTEPLILQLAAGPEARAGYSLNWAPIDGATSYNAIRGSLSSIRSVASFTVIEGAECVSRGVTAASVAGGLLDENPAPGEGFFYLVEYVCGGASGYGTETGGRQLVVTSGDSCH